MTIPLTYYMGVSAILLGISVAGFILNNKSVINLLMCIELMLLAINTNFIALAHYLGDIHGQVFVFFVLTVAAAETAIGLSIMVVHYRNTQTIAVEQLDSLKG